MRWTLMIIGLMLVGCETEGQPVADYPESDWEGALDEVNAVLVEMQAEMEQLKSQEHADNYAGVVYEVNSEMAEGCVVDGHRYIRTGVFVDGYSLIFSQTWSLTSSDAEEWELEQPLFVQGCEQVLAIHDVLVVNEEIQLWDEANHEGWDHGEVVVMPLVIHVGS